MTALLICGSCWSDFRERERAEYSGCACRRQKKSPERGCLSVMLSAAGNTINRWSADWGV
ncbi:hypothetical protein HanPSC8_Chr17g0775571 [Helianthus annuus]|nr:hypothetical protein HanPSC8_Chr17g0775571 [Helianthus annuus]